MMDIKKIQEEAESLIKIWLTAREEAEQVGEKYFSLENGELCIEDWKKKTEIANVAFMDVMEHANLHQQMYLTMFKIVEEDIQAYKNNPLWNRLYGTTSMIKKELEYDLFTHLEEGNLYGNQEFYDRYLGYVAQTHKCPSLLSSKGLEAAMKLLSFYEGDKKIFGVTVDDIHASLCSEIHVRLDKKDILKKFREKIEQASSDGSVKVGSLVMRSGRAPL